VGVTVRLAFPLKQQRTFVFVEMVHGMLRDEFGAIYRHEGLLSPATFAATGFLPLSVIEQSAAREATAVVTVSRDSAERITRRYGVNPRMIHVIPNGVDTNFYTPTPVKPRLSPFQAKKSACSILYVGHWHVSKGVLRLLHAFAIARRTDLRLRLKFAGRGPLGPTLRAESRRLGLSEQVEFLDMPDDEEVLDAYRSADIVCMPSLQEGQGIVALEAQACGVPVVATYAGGLPEAVKDRQTGLLVPPGNIQALADAVLELAHNEALRFELSRNAAAWARTFEWENVLAQSASLYEGLLYTFNSAR